MEVDSRGSPAEDHRIRRTRRLLADALVELTLERPFETITVRDLTERANIGYATFFRHYSGKVELLRAMLKEVLAELLELLEPHLGEDPAQASLVVFRHARLHADLYRLLLRTAGAIELLPEAIRVGVATTSRSYRARSDSMIPFEIAAEHLVRSFVNLIDWWLENDLPYSAERMAEIYGAMIIEPLESKALERRTAEEVAATRAPVRPRNR
ncbi:MAG TPA: TetR/AcrR family transcriptional regulator [Trueperaceae bacterium]